MKKSLGNVLLSSQAMSEIPEELTTNLNKKAAIYAASYVK